MIVINRVEREKKEIILIINSKLSCSNKKEQYVSIEIYIFLRISPIHQHLLIRPFLNLISSNYGENMAKTFIARTSIIFISSFHCSNECK